MDWLRGQAPSGVSNGSESHWAGGPWSKFCPSFYDHHRVTPLQSLLSKAVKILTLFKYTLLEVSITNNNKKHETKHGSKPRSMGRRDLKLNWWLKQRPRPMLCCSKVDGGILIGSLLQVNRYLHIGRPISTAPCVASPFAGRGAASAASIFA